MSGDPTAGSLAERWSSLDGAAKAAAVDELLLAAPPPALDVGALVTLPARWDSLPRARKIAIRRAILEARALLAQVVAHLEGP